MFPKNKSFLKNIYFTKYKYLLPFKNLKIKALKNTLIFLKQYIF